MTLWRSLYSKRCLVFTNTFTGTVFFGVADVLDQQFLQKRLQTKTVEYDSKRTANMAVAGTYFGAVGHLWYKFLDTRFPPNTRLAIPKKLFAEVVVGPPFGATVFFIVGKLEAKTWRESWTQLRHNFLFLCLMDWIFYIPLQAINFYLLAPRFRFLFVAAISIVYDTFLAHILHRQ